MHCPILELNAVEDHVHVAVCIVPNVAASDWIRHVKGLSAYAINAQFTELEETFKWQEGYGLVTFGEKIFLLFEIILFAKKSIMQKIR